MQKLKKKKSKLGQRKGKKEEKAKNRQETKKWK